MARNFEPTTPSSRAQSKDKNNEGSCVSKMCTTDVQINLLNGVLSRLSGLSFEFCKVAARVAGEPQSIATDKGGETKTPISLLEKLENAVFHAETIEGNLIATLDVLEANI